MHCVQLQKDRQGMPLMSHRCICQQLPAVGEAIAQALEEVRFGTIELIIHEGRVVQLERHEKIRLDRSTHTAE